MPTQTPYGGDLVPGGSVRSGTERLRAEDDELTDRFARQGAQRFAELLRRLGE